MTYADHTPIPDIQRETDRCHHDVPLDEECAACLTETYGSSDTVLPRRDPAAEHWNARLIREAADRVPAPRPVPTTRERLTDARRCGHTPEEHRRLDGQDADDRSKDRTIRELQAELALRRSELVPADEYNGLFAEHEALTAERDRLRAELNTAEQTATFRQGVIDRHAAELTAAGHVVNAVRTGTLEDIERALARFDTQPEASPVEADEHAHTLGTKCPAKGCRWPLGSVSPRAQDADLEPWIRRAAADPGSIAGRRRGPSWGEGEEGYAEEQETTPAWIARAVLRVLAKDGQPHCERCSQVIRVDDLYDPPLPGIGLWEHRGACPTVAAPSGCDDCSVEHGERHRYAGCPTNLVQIDRDAARARRADHAPAADEQVLRDRLETAIRAALAEKLIGFGEMALDTAAEFAAVAAVNELRQG